ncbi:MAG: TetR/AcrR family transcriptional regulator [Ilumatobacteraceae bacterium]
MPARSSTPLHLRCRPSQQRSVETFQLVLDTAATLLERHGFSGFTTNLLADEAGVTVRAVYRYFPNKHAVVAELAQQMAGRWRAAVANVGDLADVSLPWTELWPAYLNAYVAAVRATPGARAVLAAMRDDPELRAVDDIANAEYIDGIEAALAIRNPRLGADGAHAAAVVLMRTTVAVLDAAFESDDATARVLVDQLLVMHLALLTTVLDDARTDTRARA